MYQIIINGHVANSQKLAERNHWFWGEQWLMKYNHTFFNDETGAQLYTKTKAKWVSIKNIFEIKDN